MNRGFLSLLLFYLLLILLIWGCAVLFASCEILKSKKSQEIDTTKVSGIDSGHIAKSETESKTDWEWFRQTLQFPRDTNVTINNNYPARPEVVIIEGGKGTQTIIEQKIDSSWKQAFDSLASKIKTEEKTKETETKGVGLVTVCLLIIGAIVLLKLSDKIKIGLK